MTDVQPTDGARAAEHLFDELRLLSLRLGPTERRMLAVLLAPGIEAAHSTQETWLLDDSGELRVELRSVLAGAARRSADDGRRRAHLRKR